MPDLLTRAAPPAASSTSRLDFLVAPKRNFKFKPFQKEDIALAALKDGAIVGWETGLGKTVAAFAWPMVKGAKRVLIVAPEGLHRQLRDSGRRFFDLLVLPLDNIQRFYGWKLHRPPLPLNRPVFYLTSYQQLGHNGADEWAPKVNLEGLPINQIALRADREKWLRENRIPLDGGQNEEYHNGVGEMRNGITCVWRPSLARIIALHDAFDCVVVDEGTRLQANDSHIALGVRQLEPRYRMILTATPVKNRLESFFWLAWWAAGGCYDPTALWPYAGTSDAREEFANHHLQQDRFLSREKAYREETGKNRSFTRRSSRVCNIHRLWKLVAPIIVRRTKANCGEEIVARTLRPVTTPPGTDQWKVYKHYLDNPPNFSRTGKELDARSAAGIQIAFLRAAALCPWDMETARGMVQDGPRTAHSLNPKMWLVLTIIAECLERGEQAVVGSPFQEFSTALQARLNEAGVRSVLLDGRIQPTKRGLLAGEFTAGHHDVLLGGIAAMGEGYSLECCPNLILPSLDFAYDLNKQFQDRVWRINSPKPVTIYLPIVEGTVDVRLNEIFHEKSDSANLVLDGELPEEMVEETDIFAFLRGVQADSRNGGVKTIDESELLMRWPMMRERLRQAASNRE
jgi:SNF2 family DNA or RNA helicase